MGNVKLNIAAGGIFSKYMIAIQNMTTINPNFEKLYINIVDGRFTSIEALKLRYPKISDNDINCSNEGVNPFDYVLDQEFDETYSIHDARLLGNYSNMNHIEKSKNFHTYKKIINEIKLNGDLLSLVDGFVEEFNINEKTIGVHVRLTDMNILHPEYGQANYSNFLGAIKTKVTDDNNIFIASDNNESITKLKNYFGDKLHYVKDIIRGELESESINPLQIVNLQNKDLWIEAFIDMILLSKCGTLICRTSNVSNIAIIQSNTIEEIIRV